MDNTINIPLILSYIYEHYGLKVLCIVIAILLILLTIMAIIFGIRLYRLSTLAEKMEREILDVKEKLKDSTIEIKDLSKSLHKTQIEFAEAGAEIRAKPHAENLKFIAEFYKFLSEPMYRDTLASKTKKTKRKRNNS